MSKNGSSLSVFFKSCLASCASTTICGKFIGHYIQISKNDHKEELHFETGFRSI